MKRYTVTLLLLFILTCVRGQGNESLKQNIDFRIDSLGNAMIQVSAKLTATQWQYWENTYGGKNISIFNRDLSRSMYQFYLYDFDYEDDKMERTFKVTFKAKGVARYQGNNTWLAEVGIKNPGFSKLDDQSYLVTTSMNDGGQLIQQNNTIRFPKKAANIKEDTDEFGAATFTYELKPSAGRSPLLLILGLALLVAGIAYALFVKLKPTPATA